MNGSTDTLLEQGKRSRAAAIILAKTPSALKNQALIQELDKLGIDAGKNQLEQIISSDESIVLNPLFQNEIGLFDFNKFSNYISQLKTSNPTIYNSWKLQEENIISLAKQKIYFDLIKSSVIYTNVESNIQYHLENDKVNIESVSYTHLTLPTIYSV